MSGRPGPIAATAAAALALLCWGAAAAPDSDAAERARIAADRQAVQARFEIAKRDCEARFVVNQCLEQAHRARREALAPLQRQTYLLDDARRRARAAQRLLDIQARESAAAAKPALAPAAPASARAAGAAAPSAKPRVQHVLAPPAAASAAAQAQRRAAQQQQRLRDAQAHQEAVQARNAKRDAHRPPAAGLPIPVSPASTP